MEGRLTYHIFIAASSALFAGAVAVLRWWMKVDVGEQKHSTKFRRSFFE
jgi:hypothetical protein